MRRFGAILWDAAATIDDAICFARIFYDPNEAIVHLSGACREGQRWAVVDLQSRTVVAEGSSAGRTGQLLSRAEPMSSGLISP